MGVLFYILIWLITGMFVVALINFFTNDSLKDDFITTGGTVCMWPLALILIGFFLIGSFTTYIIGNVIKNIGYKK